MSEKLYYFYLFSFIFSAMSAGFWLKAAYVADVTSRRGGSESKETRNSILANMDAASAALLASVFQALASFAGLFQ